MLGVPVGAALLGARSDWRSGVSERLGLHGPSVQTGAVWVHGASVGEILAATRLVDALSERGHPVVVSTTTATGRAVIARNRPEVPRSLAPLDHPWSTGLALDRLQPAALIFVELELWPVWWAAAARRGIPLGIVSGRISDRGLRRYQQARLLFAPSWARLAAIGARTEEDARRFVSLGVAAERVRVTGDLKLEPPTGLPKTPADLAALLGEREPLVAASTHPGEESAAIGALLEARRAGVDVSLVLAPRRLERVPEIAREVEARGLEVRLRSVPSSDPLRAGEVLLLDTLGELPALMSRARIVFVGGTLAPVGGHNVLEPALAARPVLFGPHTENVREAAERLLACGAARRVAHGGELAAVATELLLDPARARKLGESGLRELERHAGATVRSVELVEQLLAAGSAS